MKRSTILLAVLSLPLTAASCGERPRLEIVKPSPDKLICPDEPGAPARRGPNGRVTDEDAGRYMGDLRKAWQGCRADVDWLRDWFAKQK